MPNSIPFTETEINTLNLFRNIKSLISIETLNLINKSPTLVGQLRSINGDLNYAPIASDNVKPDAASIPLPSRNGQGRLLIGINIFSDPAKLVDALSHETGHYAVESGKVGAMRNLAVATKDVLLYEDACNLTEGYARSNQGQVWKEIGAAGGLVPLRYVATTVAVERARNEVLSAMNGLNEVGASVDDTVAFMLGAQNRTAPPGSPVVYP